MLHAITVAYREVLDPAVGMAHEDLPPLSAALVRRVVQIAGARPREPMKDVAIHRDRGSWRAPGNGDLAQHRWTILWRAEGKGRPVRGERPCGGPALPAPPARQPVNQRPRRT